MLVNGPFLEWLGASAGNLKESRHDNHGLLVISCPFKSWSPGYKLPSQELKSSTDFLRPLDEMIPHLQPLKTSHFNCSVLISNVGIYSCTLWHSWWRSRTSQAFAGGADFTKPEHIEKYSLQFHFKGESRIDFLKAHFWWVERKGGLRSF